MGRPLNPDLTKYWKLSLPATLAGTVEFYLFDRIHNKPEYGARAKLIASLLTEWVEIQKTGKHRPEAIALLREVRLMSAQTGTPDLWDKIDAVIALLTKQEAATIPTPEPSDAAN